MENIKAAGTKEYAVNFTEASDDRFKLGTVSFAPGKIRFFGYEHIQDEDMKIRTDADDKLHSLAECYIWRPRCKQSSQPINKIENSIPHGPLAILFVPRSFFLLSAFRLSFFPF